MAFTIAAISALVLVLPSYIHAVYNELTDRRRSFVINRVNSSSRTSTTSATPAELIQGGATPTSSYEDLDRSSSGEIIMECVPGPLSSWL